MSPLLKQLARQWTAAKACAGTAPFKQASEQGLTLLECLMAVVVISITVAMVTPPLFLAAATRQQNRKAEQALQIAQGEVDRIRAIVARSDHEPDNLPKTLTENTALKDVAAPTAVSSLRLSSIASCNTYTDQQLETNEVLPVDIDGDADCKPDFLMQVFRTRGTISYEEENSGSVSKKPSDFEVGVRVYSALAMEGNGLRSGLRTDPASLQLVGGTGYQSTRPLAVLYTPFSWSDQSATLCTYHETAEGPGLEGCVSGEEE